MYKKLICLLMAVTVIVPCLSITNVSLGANDTMTTLASLVERFPNGKYWNNVDSAKNNSDSVTSTPCASHRGCAWNKTCDCNNFDNAIQCMGYAHKIAYEITGVMPRNNFVKVTSLKASALRVGDIIRYRWDGHSLCVTGVSGNKISFTDCNWVGRCQIRWGVMDISDIQGFNYVYHLPGNDRKNSDLYFYKNTDNIINGSASGEDVSKNDPHEDWRMVGATLNVRAEYTTDSNVVGKIYDGTEFKVYDKYDDGEYLWGKILFGNTVGWCALNYAQYEGGEIETPNFKNTSEVYVQGEKITLSWREICGAGKYWLYIYNEDGEVVQKYTVMENSKSLVLDEGGDYTARVYAANSLTPDWKIMGKEYSFTVMEKQDIVNVSSISLSAPEKLAKGEVVSVKATVKPADATNKSLIWKSSDASVATVNANGKVTAQKYGTVKITCTAADTKQVKKTVTITVVPSKVTGINQNYSTAGKLGLTWKKVTGATQYNIYLYDEPTDSYNRVAITDDTSCVFKVDAGCSFRFRIYALAKAEGEYYYSEPSQAVTAVSGPQAAKLTAKQVGSDAVLSWKKVSGATHYVIYRVVGSELIKLDTVDADTLTYTAENLKEESSYQFRVRTLRKDDGVIGYGAYSNTVKIP